MVDVKISYETLFDILRREKQREDLQELPNTFVKDVISYLSDKETILRKHVEINDPFGPREQENAKIQLKNVRKILKELFERRENKIIRLAQDKVRQGPNLNLHLLDEEKDFYTELITCLQNQRVRLLHTLLISQPIIRPPQPIQKTVLEPERQSRDKDEERPQTIQTHEQKKEMPQTVVSGAEGTEKEMPQAVIGGGEGTEKEMPQAVIGGVKLQEKTTPQEISSPAPVKSTPDTPKKPTLTTDEHSFPKRIRIINPLPRFVGPELEVYGPYAESTVTTLPPPIADLLIRKGRAEEVK